jgi:hypothetical protein
MIGNDYSAGTAIRLPGAVDKTVDEDTGLWSPAFVSTDLDNRLS